MQQTTAHAPVHVVLCLQNILRCTPVNRDRNSMLAISTAYAAQCRGCHPPEVKGQSFRLRYKRIPAAFFTARPRSALSLHTSPRVGLVPIKTKDRRRKTEDQDSRPDPPYTAMSLRQVRICPPSPPSRMTRAFQPKSFLLIIIIDVKVLSLRFSRDTSWCLQRASVSATAL